ncbi:hypothetical protein AMECASPLE_035992 [Ameca splendens]|uniref:Uncharacterized protein n=1 Tax=Ameca splendens TaxID=208324 RepID=A0ABV0ZG99_9TELE
MFPKTNQAASCFPQSSEPRHNRTLFTLQRKYLNIELTPDLNKAHSTAQEKPSGLFRFVNQDPESLYPWRPDCTYLVSCFPVYYSYFSLISQHNSSWFHHFSSPSFHTVADSPIHVPVSLVNKTPFTDSVLLQSVLQYVGQINYKNNDTLLQNFNPFTFKIFYTCLYAPLCNSLSFCKDS